MKNKLPIELKNVKFGAGISHEMLKGSLYLNDKKIGEILDDGWCDELYIEFKNQKSQNLFSDEFNKCLRRKRFKFKTPEEFLRYLAKNA